MRKINFNKKALADIGKTFGDTGSFTAAGGLVVQGFYLVSHKDELFANKTDAMKCTGVKVDRSPSWTLDCNITKSVDLSGNWVIGSLCGLLLLFVALSYMAYRSRIALEMLSGQKLIYRLHLNQSKIIYAPKGGQQ